jgi:hypothetical protein
MAAGDKISLDTQNAFAAAAQVRAVGKIWEEKWAQYGQTLRDKMAQTQFGSDPDGVKIQASVTKGFESLWPVVRMPADGCSQIADECDTGISMHEFNDEQLAKRVNRLRQA